MRTFGVYLIFAAVALRGAVVTSDAPYFEPVLGLLTVYGLFKSARQKKEKFWILNLRPGRILIEADQDIDSLNLVTTEESVIPAVKVSDRFFFHQLKNNLVIGSVRLVPRDNSLKSINIRISREPVSSPLFAAYQFAFLFLLVGLEFVMFLCFYSVIIERPYPTGLPIAALVPGLLLLIAAVFAFFILNVGKVLDFSGHPDPPKALGAPFCSTSGLDAQFLAGPDDTEARSHPGWRSGSF